MFNLFKKDPASALEKEYRALLEKARDAQRSGDIKLYAKLTDESEQVLTRIQHLKKGS
jgi:hypothetical protein